MLISLIIPTYNYAKVLPRALESIIKQIRDEIEIFVIDDGSTDNTATQMLAYQHLSFIHYHRQTNQGPATARHLGISLSHGEYLIFLDADDELHPLALSHFITAAQQNSQADFFLAPHFSVLENGKKKKSLVPYLSLHKEKNFVAYLKKKISICHGAFMVKRSVFQRLRYPSELIGREDMVFFAHLFANYQGVALSSPTVLVYKHADSLRHAITQKIPQVDTLITLLFDPNYLPAICWQQEKSYRAQLYLSNFRLLFLARHYREARQWYWKAIQAHYTALFRWSYFKKLISSYLMS